MRTRPALTPRSSSSSTTVASATRRSTASSWSSSRAATGTGRQSYAAFDLDGYVTDANGYFVLGNPGVPGASLIFEPGRVRAAAERSRCRRALRRQRERFPQRHERDDDEPAGRDRLRHRRSERVGSAAAAECRPADRQRKRDGEQPDAVEPALPQRHGRLPEHVDLLPGRADARSRQQLPGAAAAERRRDQPDLRRRRQRRRDVSQRLRRAVQPRRRRRSISPAGRCSTRRRREAAGISTSSRWAARSAPASTT